MQRDIAWNRIRNSIMSISVNILLLASICVYMGFIFNSYVPEDMVQNDIYDDNIYWFVLCMQIVDK